MSRTKKIAWGVLIGLVVAGGIYFGGLYRRVLQLAGLETPEEVARRAVLQLPAAPPSAETEPVQIYLASTNVPGTLEPVTLRLPRSRDLTDRARQLIEALVSAPTPQQRTLPPATTLLELYVLPNGLVVADFSPSLATDLPSGILSEELAVRSLIETLRANLPQLKQLKILLGGQEATTLAGHVDLTAYFLLGPPETSSSEGWGLPGLTAWWSPGTLDRQPKETDRRSSAELR